MKHHPSELVADPRHDGTIHRSDPKFDIQSWWREVGDIALM